VRGLKRPLNRLPKGPVLCSHLGLFPGMYVFPCIGFRHFISRHRIGYHPISILRLLRCRVPRLPRGWELENSYS
jgi:hypothetical protein